MIRQSRVMSAWDWLWLGLVALVLVLASIVAFLAALRRFWIAPTRDVQKLHAASAVAAAQTAAPAGQAVEAGTLGTAELLADKPVPPDAPDEAELALREDDEALEPDDSDEAALEAGMSHGGVQESTADRVEFEDDEEGGIAR